MSQASAGTNPRLQRWFGLLSALAAVAALQALVLPRWPRSQPLPAALLRAGLAQAGFKPRPLATLPAVRSYERTLSPVIGWTLNTGAELRLVRASARQRDSFQAAFFGRDQPALTLRSRRLNQPQAGSAAGLIQGRAAFQTCLVPEIPPSVSMAVTAEALGQAADQQVAGRTNTLKGLLGLQPTRRFECVLVSLRSNSQKPPALATWQDVLRSVSASLRPSLKR